MSADPLQQAQQNWTRRSQQFIQAGGDLNKLQPIIQEDFARVQKGGTPYNDTQAYQQMSAVLGNPLVPPQQPRHGIADLFGNFVGDIRNDVAGAGKMFMEGLTNPAALYHQLDTSLWQPTVAGVEHFGDPNQQGQEKITGIGSFLRDVADIPAAGMIPGVSTAAGLTSAAGRRGLMQHPGSTLLDVLPLVGSGTEAFAKLSGIAGTASDIAAKALGDQGIVDAGTANLITQEWASANPLMAKQYKWMKAMADGHPLKALMTQSDLLTKVGDSLSLLPADVKDMLLRKGSTMERTGAEQLQAKIAAFKDLMETTSSDPKAQDITNRLMQSLNTVGGVTTGMNPITNEDIAYLAEKLNMKPEDILGKMVDLRTHSKGLIEMAAKIDPRLQEMEYMAKDGTIHKYHVYHKDSDSYLGKVGKLQGTQDHYNALRAKMQQAIAAAPKDAKKQVILDLSHQMGKELADAQKAYSKAAGEYDKALQDSVPVELSSAMSAQARSAILSGKIKMSGIDFTKPEFLQKLTEASTITKMGQIFLTYGGEAGKRDFQKFIRDMAAGWKQLVDQGFDPVWFGVTKPDTKFDISRMKINFNAAPPDIFRRGLDVTPTHPDNVVGLSRMAKLAIEFNVSDEYKKLEQAAFGVKREEAMNGVRIELLASRYGKKMQALGTDAFDQALQARFARDFESTEYTSTDIVMPKAVAETFKKMVASEKPGAFTKLTSVYNKEMKLYKFAVLTSPRHLAHVTFGGMMMMMLRDPMGLVDIIKAANLYHNIHDVLPEMFQGEGTWGANDADKLASVTAGKTMGRLWKGIRHIQEPIKRFEDYVSNLQRSALALSVAHGDLDALKLTDGAINEVRQRALQEVFKTFVDMDNATPMERTIIKNVFPFYAFTKHILKFTLQYPVDYPFRAEILDKLATQEIADQQSGLPLTFSHIFWIGQQDSAGNRLGVDLKSFNPFRSVSNDYTLAGFMSNLNPAISLPFEAMGINKLTATPELYPQLSIDPNTGGLVAQRPNIIESLADVIPQGGVLDHFLKFSSSMRDLARNDPEAYKRQLYNAIGFPFMPTRYNIPLDKAKFAAHNLLVAQQAVSNFMNSGDPQAIQGWQRLPYQGQYLTPDQMENLYAEAAQTLGLANVPNTSIKALLPNKRRRGHVSFTNLMQGLVQ